MDPLAGSPWSAPNTVAGFARSLPNEVLMRSAEAALARRPGGRLLDIGCGAARNALPLAELGWRVLGIDLSWPMLNAAVARARNVRCAGDLQFALAPMERLPVRDRCIDFVVAHGIWNLAPSAAIFRHAAAEAARVAKPDASLFVFTFSRNTLPADARPIANEPFVYTQFSGQPQCFLTEDELVKELGSAGFALDSPISEYNRRAPSDLAAATGPVIYEALFRLRP
jgi:ubiquinone/menaquinone biosynthesis C-methylase UbiE